METSVESLCNLLVRSRLLQAKDVKVVHQRWRAEAKQAAGDINQFSKWLVNNKFVTEYQAGMLLRGKADNFFFNQYKLLDRIGKGRMAGIYKAVHQLGQTVAIKVLPPSKAKDPECLGRFQREARLATKLKHPNVVRTFQIGTANNLYYIVMEYLDGDTLDEVLDRRKTLPPNEAVRLFYQALQGLDHIHQQDMVHRDIKPANLMLVPGQVRGQPDTTLRATLKILDIGVGRALFDEGGTPGSPDFQLTTTGEMLGTPDYLAPEQARDAHSADIRADIYSLGCVLYHCLAGQPPFQDANKVRQMVRHATEQARPLKEFNPAIPDGLQQIVNQMMAKDPAQRFPTPERAAQALQAFLASGSDPQRPEEVKQEYLQWLESVSDVVPVPAPVAAVAAQRSAPRPPAAAPVPRPPALPPTGPHGAATQSVPLVPQAARASAPAPAAPKPAAIAVPAGLAPTVIPTIPFVPLQAASPPTAAPAGNEVVLVPVASAQEPAKSRLKLLDLSKLSPRQYLLLGFGIGVGGMLITIVLAFVLASWLNR